MLLTVSAVVRHDPPDFSSAAVRITNRPFTVRNEQDEASETSNADLRLVDSEAVDSLDDRSFVLPIGLLRFVPHGR